MDVKQAQQRMKPAAMAHNDLQVQDVTKRMEEDLVDLEHARNAAQDAYIATSLESEDDDERLCRQLEYDVMDLQLQLQRKKLELHLQRNKKQNTTATTTKTGE